MTVWRRVYADNRLLFLLVLAGIVLNVVAYLVVSPLRSAVDEAQRRASAEEARVVQARAADQRARDTLASKTQATEDLATFTSRILPADQATARRLLHVRLVELAERYDLSYDRQTLTQSTQRDRDLTRLDVAMVLVGDYPSVREFIHAIESGDDFLVISELGLSQPRDVDRLVELAIRVSTYYRDGDAG